MAAAETTGPATITVEVHSLKMTTMGVAILLPCEMPTTLETMTVAVRRVYLWRETVMTVTRTVMSGAFPARTLPLGRISRKYQDGITTTTVTARIKEQNERAVPMKVDRPLICYCSRLALFSPALPISFRQTVEARRHLARYFRA